MKKLTKLSLLLVSSIGAFESFAATPPVGCVLGTTPTMLTAKGPKYTAIGYSRQYKGDYPFSIPPVDRSVGFYNSEDGYVGSGNTNLESNAYLNMSFDYSRGEQWFWVIDDSNACS